MTDEEHKEINNLTIDGSDGKLEFTPDNLYVENTSGYFDTVKQETLKLCKTCECYVCPSCEKAHIKDSLTNERIPRWNANVDTIHCYCEKCFSKFALDMTHDPVL